MAETRIDELRRRLERDPGSRLFAQLAEEHRKAGDHAEAIRVARAGLALHHAYPSARLTLGRALLDSGDAAAARTELAEVLREAPDNILASRFLGQALEMAGDFAGALTQYASTLKMAPGDRQLEAQVAALRLRAQSGARVTPEVTAPMRPVAPPLPPSAGAVPRRPAAAASPPAGRPAPPPAPRPAVPPPPPTQRMVQPSASPDRAPERTVAGPSPSEPTILIRPAAAPGAAPSAPAQAPTPVAAPRVQGDAAIAPGGRLAGAPASMSRTVTSAPPEGPEAEAPTVPRVVVPDLSAFVSTLPPAGRPAAQPAEPARPAAAAVPVPAQVAEDSFDEALDAASSATAPVARVVSPVGANALPPEPIGGAPDAEIATPAPEPASPADAPADTVDGGPPAPATPATTPSPPPAAPDLAAETLAPAPPAAAPPAAPPVELSSSTLAELYLRQGLTGRAREVYLQVLAEDPANERARAGLRDLEAAVALGGPVAERAARRAALQRTIEALEAMLAAVRRD